MRQIPAGTNHSRPVSGSRVPNTHPAQGARTILVITVYFPHQSEVKMVFSRSLVRWPTGVEKVRDRCLFDCDDRRIEQEAEQCSAAQRSEPSLGDVTRLLLVSVIILGASDPIDHQRQRCRCSRWYRPQLKDKRW